MGEEKTVTGSGGRWERKGGREGRRKEEMDGGKRRKQQEEGCTKRPVLTKVGILLIADRHPCSESEHDKAPGQQRGMPAPSAQSSVCMAPGAVQASCRPETAV